MESAAFDHGRGPDFPTGIVEGDAMEREDVQRVGVEIHSELIKAAARDAVERVKPRR